MTNTLDREIRLWVNPKDSGLERWALQEFDDKGLQVGGNQVPWSGRNFFTATKLHLRYFLEGNDENPDDLEGDSRDLKEQEAITAELHPGHVDNGELRDASEYSMFGTDRIISKFSLRIVRLQNKDSKEGVTVWGTPSYTLEIDFRNFYEKDCIQITIFLGADKFSRLAHAVKTGAVDSVVLTLSYVRGFYSEWTPTIFSDRIKVLTADEEQKVQIPDGCDIRPHRLFDFQLLSPERTVSDTSFSLTFEKRMELKFDADDERPPLKSMLRGPSELYRRVEADRQKEEARAQYASLLISRIERNEEALNALRIPIWLIFLLLIIGFLIGVFR